MSYRLTVNLGTVTRIADNKQVAPCDSDTDPDFLAYQQWVAAGNQPEEVYADVGE